MAYEFVYESEAKRYRSDCTNVLKETCELLKEKGISAQFSLVGSGARNMITRNGEGPYDLDYNLWNQYTWNEVPRSHQVKDRADEIKKEGLWQEVRDRYLEKKNMYLSWQDRNPPSFVVYVETVNEVYNRYFNRGGGYSVQSIFRLR